MHIVESKDIPPEIISRMPITITDVGVIFFFSTGIAIGGGGTE